MKIIFSFIAISTLVFASSEVEIQKQIEQAMQEKKAIDKKIELLKSQLPKKEKKNPFVSHTEFGYIKTGGNTDTETFNIDITVKKSWNKHSAKFHADAQYAEDKGTKSKNKYFLELEYNYVLTPRLSRGYMNGYRDDEFSTYKYQFYTGPGISYKVIKNAKHNLKIDTNILFSQDKIEQRRDYVSFRSKGLYSWQILDNLKFEQSISYRTELKDRANYFVYSKSSLTTKLSELFSTGISYKYDYVSLPSTDKKHQDDTLTINLIMDY